MKHIRIFLILISILLLCGCNEENKKLITDNESDAPAMRFYGSIESRADSSDVTRSTLSGTPTDNTRKVLWEPSDSIYVTNGSTGSKFKNVTDENSDVAEFLGNIEPGSSYYAFFPYGAVKSYSSSQFQISLPSVQEYKSDGIASESFPMVAQCVDNIFEFRNLCGILVLYLKGTAVIDSIRFSGTDDAEKPIIVSGLASVSTSYTDVPGLVMDPTAVDYVNLNCIGSTGKGVSLDSSKPTPFHIVLPTGVYAHFTVVIYSSDGERMTINSEKPLSIKRSKRTTASSIDYLADEPVYEYVDLGLRVNWATCNVGATAPEEYGDYYAWGDTEPYDHDELYWFYDRGDVAHVKWGGNWRMPDSGEQYELCNNCTWTWYDSGNTEFNGVAGYKVTSNIDGYTDRSIFLPAAGYRDGAYLYGVGSDGYYWSSSLDQAVVSGEAWYLGFSKGYHNICGIIGWNIGQSVRPVCPSEDFLNNVTITLNNNSQSIVLGNTYTLIFTVKRGNDVIDQEVTWTSANPSIATVSETGVVTGVAVGTTTITVTCLDKTATCTIIIVPKQNGIESGREYVDLGLSIKWATFNVGATKPEEYGDYFAWGETETKTDYSWSTYKWCNGSNNTLTKYNTSSNFGAVDNKTVLDPEDDVVHVKWGGDWRMPTREELDELSNSNNCTWKWYDSDNSEFGGVAGYKVTSKKSGYTDCFIFLPAAGWHHGSYFFGAGELGCYCSSSLRSEFDPDGARILYFGSDNRYAGYPGSRYEGQSVRPVCP